MNSSSPQIASLVFALAMCICAGGCRGGLWPKRKSPITVTPHTDVVQPAACPELTSGQTNSMVRLASYVEPAQAPKTSSADDKHPDESDQHCSLVHGVSTINSPESPQRSISLAECIALALENGRTGELFDSPGGIATTDPAQPNQAATDSIRVFAYEPAIFGTQIDESLAKFDAFWRAGATVNHADRPFALGSSFGFGPIGPFGPFGPLAGLGPFGPFGPFPPSVNESDLTGAEHRSDFVKPLPTGGVAGVSARVSYQDFALPFLLNPTYRPALEMSFEQPLLRGAGVFLNQLREKHPGGFRTPVPVGGTAPGILLARISHNQSQLEFERRVHLLLFSVEDAYWRLYRAYWELYSREAAMKQAISAWQIAKQRHDRGDPATGIEEVAQIEQEYHLYRVERLEALGRGLRTGGGVLEAERRLRYVVGLPIEDGTRLIPADTPTTAPFLPNWSEDYTQALGRRPELVQVQQEIRKGELLLARARNDQLPDLRFFSRVGYNGIGTNLADAVEDLNQFQSQFWDLGLVVEMPFGDRQASSIAARVRLEIARRHAFLREQEGLIISSLQRSHRDLVQLREEIQIRHSRRQAAALQLETRLEKFRRGAQTIDLLLEAQRRWANALRAE